MTRVTQMRPDRIIYSSYTVCPLIHTCMYKLIFLNWLECTSTEWLDFTCYLSIYTGPVSLVNKKTFYVIWWHILRYRSKSINDVCKYSFIHRCHVCGGTVITINWRFKFIFINLHVHIPHEQTTCIIHFFQCWFSFSKFMWNQLQERKQFCLKFTNCIQSYSHTCLHT